MSGAPSEPEKYSIDEMMDRLKSSSSTGPGDGELVTRSDGTQAVRVRKRKRRSTQPHKDEVSRTRRARIVQVSAALILLFVAAIAVGSAIIYGNSSPFRQGLVNKIETASGATAEIEQFRINPKTANAARLTLKWPAGNVLRKLDLGNLSAEIFPSTFLGKSMNGEEIFVSRASLNLQLPQTGEAVRNQPAATTSAINFNRYRSQVLDITVGAPEAPAITLTKSEGSLSNRNVGGQTQLTLYQGDLAISGWPKLLLDRALIEFRGEETDVIGLRMLTKKDDPGSFELSGTFNPYKPDTLSTLAVSLESFELDGILGPDLGKLFDGRVDSQPMAKSNYFSFRPTATPSPKLDIAFAAASNSRIIIQGFPFLAALSQTLDYPWFEHPVFDDENSGQIVREPGVISLKDLNFESKGHMALRGDLSVAANQTMSGTLRVGVADSIVATSKTARLKTMFSEPSEGFCWITLKISGQAGVPKDNFKELFSASEAAPAESPAPNDYKGSTFEELTRPR